MKLDAVLRVRRHRARGQHHDEPPAERNAVAPSSSARFRRAATSARARRTGHTSRRDHSEPRRAGATSLTSIGPPSPTAGRRRRTGRRARVVAEHVPARAGRREQDRAPPRGQLERRAHRFLDRTGLATATGPRRARHSPAPRRSRPRRTAPARAPRAAQVDALGIAARDQDDIVPPRRAASAACRFVALESSTKRTPRSPRHLLASMRDGNERAQPLATPRREAERGRRRPRAAASARTQGVANRDPRARLAVQPATSTRPARSRPRRRPAGRS